MISTDGGVRQSFRELRGKNLTIPDTNWLPYFDQIIHNIVYSYSRISTVERISEKPSGFGQNR